MAISCGSLTTGILGADCDNPLVQGLRPDVTLINHEDIDLTLTTITDGVITSLVLKKGVVGYKASMLPRTTTSTVAMAKGAYSNGWDQNLSMRILNIGPDVKKFIEGLAKSRIVAVVANNHVNFKGAEKGNTVFEAYGFYTGLQLNENSRDTEDADTRGGYIITLGCSDNAKEPSLPITIFDTDLETTQTMVDTLLVKRV